MIKIDKKVLVAILAAVSIGGTTLAKQPERGYRGFVEWSNNYRSVDFWGEGFRTSIFYTGVSSTHGYQINQKYFAGAGVDVEYCSNMSVCMASVFADGRMDLTFGRFTPYVDARLGYVLNKDYNLYFSPQIGYRFNWGRKFAINAGLGMSLLRYSVPVYEVNEIENGYEIINTGRRSNGSEVYFSFRIGFEF